MSSSSVLRARVRALFLFSISTLTVVSLLSADHLRHAAASENLVLTLTAAGPITPGPGLGNYQNTIVTLAANATITPDAAPVGAVAINVAASKGFNGTFVANPSTGVVRITNAYPSGTYTITVRAFDGVGAATTKAFTLTVQSGVACSGATVFTSAANVGTATGPVSVAIGDFNNDGKQDLAIVGRDANSVSIRLGDGTGGFVGSTEISVGGSPRSVAIGDFNNDGRQDLAVADNSNSVSIRLGDGSGGFTGSTEVAMGTSLVAVAVGDFNNDGYQDLAAASVNSASVAIRLGDGLGNFSGSTTVSVGTTPQSIAIGDFNGDGQQDLAVANAGSNSVSIRLGDGLGGFSGTTAITVGSSPDSVAIGDFNNDSKQDIAVANQFGSSISIRLGDGLGGFSGSTNVSVGGLPSAVAIGDFNNDGKQDLVSANNATANASVRLGDGLGGFSGSTTLSVGGGPFAVAVGDFNGDGIQDFAVATFGTNSAAIRMGGCNAAPTVTAATGLSRQQGSPASNSKIATVTDDGGNGAVTVTVTSANPSNGITISNIVNTAGNITADIVAGCAASNATFTLQASDGSATATDTLTVSTIANTAPSLSYADPAAVSFGGSLSVNPANGPSDNVSVNSITVQSTGTYTGTISVNNSTGVVSISNAAPAGTHTITIRATDNCGAITDATFSLTVNCRSANVVANSSDSGAGSLREAVLNACAGSTITFDMSPGHVTSLIQLTSGLAINRSLSIQGPAADLLNISGNNNFRLINAAAAGVNLSISGLTLSSGGAEFGTKASGIEFTNAGTLTLANCVMQQSTSSSSRDLIFASLSTAVIVNGCTIFNNGTNDTIKVDRTPLTVVNSTFSSNSGPAIYNAAAGSAVVNSTFANNSAGIKSDSVLCGGCAADIKVTNTLFSNNGSLNLQTSGTATISSGGNNLIDDSTASAFSTSDSTNIIVPANATGLIGLAQNGGPTRTMALMAGSPAINAGNNAIVTNPPFTGPPFTDGRGTGFSRTVDSTTDIGAFEAQVLLEDISDKTINEDSQLSFVLNVGGAVATVTASSSATALVPNNPANIAVSGTGSQRTLTITPLADAFGVTTITVTVSDGNGQSMSDTFQLTVNAVNDAPSFVKGPDQPVNEDSGFRSVSNWATNISTGPSNEFTQTLSFQVTDNTNPSLFSVGPAVSSIGVLTFTPAANANGSATITINLKDNGGTANGGIDTSTSQSFTITVNPVNDAPSFTKGANQTVNNNGGAQTVPNWATNISPGPADESSQTLTFQVTSVNNPSLFSVQPAISPNGTLTYTPAPDAGSSTTVFVNLKDSGGTANNGVDTSSTQSFSITVVPVGGSFSFDSTSIDTNENSGSVTTTVRRTGNTTRAVTVDYATNGDNGLPCSNVSGVASPKCDFTPALGTLNFAVGETSKTIPVLISQDSFVEGTETITLTLSNPTNNSTLIAGTTTALIRVQDDATEPPTNIIDDPNMFVRMHYHDFLNREADQSGLNFWTGQMTNCGSSDLNVCRVNVSGAFFLSIEFQQTGYLVERIYKTAYGDATGTSTLGSSHQLAVPVVRFNEFLKDTQRIGQGVVVLAPGWEQALENNKQTYAGEFVATSRFIGAFPTTMTPTQFVDQLNQNAGSVLSASERTTAINLFSGAADSSNTTARAQALRQVAEDQDLFSAEFNRAFVLTEFFGYLRRNPNDLPDSDYTGYDFWLTKLNQFNGDYIAAEMVKAFIASSEYRQRFGP